MYAGLDINKYLGKYWDAIMFKMVCIDKYVYACIDEYRQE